MKIRPLFSKYQQYLLAFANTKYGRMYLGIKDNNRICKITPDSFHVLKEKTIQATFYSRSLYLKKFRLALEGLEIANDLIGKIYKPDYVIPHFQGLTYVNWLPLLMKDSLTAYPDSDEETTTVDGRAYAESVAGTTWATLHDAATGDGAVDDGNTGYCCQITADNESNKWNYIQRGFFLFDTSSLGASASIVSATFSLYSDAKVDSATLNQSISLVACTPASNTAITTADFDQVGTTQFASDIDLGSINTSAYNDFALNTAGKAAISKTGVTKFATRASSDRADSAPTWGDSEESYVSVEFADNEGNKPKLVVTYTTPGFFALL